MKKILLFLSIFILATISYASTLPDKTTIVEKSARLQIPFIENKGHIKDKAAKFYASTFAGNVYVTDEGQIIYGLVKEDSSNQKGDEKTYQMVTLKETIIGATKTNIKGESKSATQVNYFVGSKDEWKTGIPTWESVNLGEVYEGIELKLKAYGKNVEKLFYVNECGDVEDIKLKFEGAENITVNESGELEIETAVGTVKFTKPFAYQEIEGKKVEVEADFIIGSSLSYGFQVASYNKSYPLIIDPLLASTFIGGSASDGATCINIDPSGNVFVSGRTNSSGFPAQDAYDPSYNGGYSYGDIFVSKIDNTLSTLLASTFIGGNNDEAASAMTIDPSGNVFVTGGTSSHNYPITENAYDNSNSGSYFYTIFVSKLDNTLSNLLSSTLIGRDGYSIGFAIAVDSSENVFVAGETASADFPTTEGAYDTSFNDGSAYGGDVFVSKLDSTLSSLLASTFIGGNYDEYAFALKIDNSGNVFLTGRNESSDFPTTIGAYNTSGGVFVSKLNNTLSSLLASTFINGYEASAMTIDSVGNIYIAGTASNPPSGGVFVSKLDNTLSSLLASTFIGGLYSGSEGKGIAIDSIGNVFVTGKTLSSIFPTTMSSYDTSFNGSYDVFVSKLDSTLSSIIASTLIGGNDSEVAYGIAVDSNGNIFIAGDTLSSYGTYPYPSTNGAYNTLSNGSNDCFVSKFDNNLSAGTGTSSAITLVSFTARLKESSVQLKWQTETEIDNIGFNILRSESEEGPYKKINKNIIHSKGSSTKGASYKFTDNKV
ncbi:MAG: SBBP repeat-containing protein, partial [Candidatus Schekmanbacteria bacterium]|nr:SBBP repeat-containing protein [Candidatus Schekmanbacteria bacterium]